MFVIYNLSICAHSVLIKILSTCISIRTILEGHMCLDIFVLLAAGEQANICLLIFIQNVSHDLSVDDNLLLKKMTIHWENFNINRSTNCFVILDL